MPAAAVASFTPAISGISGTSVGASGETAVDMGGFRLRGGKRSVSPHPQERERGGRVITAAVVPALSRDPYSPALVVTEGLCHSASTRGGGVWVPDEGRDDAKLLLRWRHHLGVSRLGGGRFRLGVGLVIRLGGLFRLVHALDLGGLAQLGDVVGLRL